MAGEVAAALGADAATVRVALDTALENEKTRA